MAMSIIEGSASESASKFCSETEDFQVQSEATSCGLMSHPVLALKPRTTWNPTQKNHWQTRNGYKITENNKRI